MKRWVLLFISVLLLFVPLLLVSCNNTNGNTNVCIPSGNTARYTVTFNALWSAATHPTNIPSNPHFSRLIGATHNEVVSFWKPGGFATAGIESMAETGGISLLTDEIENAISTGNACSVITGSGVNPSPGSVSVTFTVGSDRPLVTLTTMVAPSPDWFLGVQGLSLVDENGDWVSDLTVDLFVYDAGTDSGVSFTSEDNDTNPRETIIMLSGGDFDTAFGQFTFVKQ